MLLDYDDGTGGRPETPRAELRRILPDSRPDGTVRWGHKVVSCGCALSARDGTNTSSPAAARSPTFSVGADGARSPILPCCPLPQRNTPVLSGS